MIALRGGSVVVADRVLPSATLILDKRHVVDVVERDVGADETVDCRGAWIVPGFIDVHVHGVDGIDALDPGWPVAELATRLVRYGVTAFCPTAVACAPNEIAGLLAAAEQARHSDAVAARVLGVHLESNFINPSFRGAQPLTCLRRVPFGGEADDMTGYSGGDVLAAIEALTPAVRIVTLASELPGGIDLVRWLTGRGIRASLGHSCATYDEAVAAFDAGATQVTHLFNRMPPLHHREPGLAGAALQRDDVVTELICDGVHVHPAVVGMARRAKGPAGVLAITDGTAGAGLQAGARTRLGGRSIVVGDGAAYLDDGTLAGSVLTMDAAFRGLVNRFGCTPWEAAACCATNPARALGLGEMGEIRPGALADLVVLERDWCVRETWVGGRRCW
ncbi:MAG: N-acetylglucosamine-6-phosphate deacetylase [Vicinamibacterales bacterium]